MRLLVIEDEPDLAQALAKGLRHQGYAVDIAYDGLAGWELASVNEYDLLILDLNLPEMDGLEGLPACKDRPTCTPHSGTYGAEPGRRTGSWP